MQVLVVFIVFFHHLSNYEYLIIVPLYLCTFILILARSQRDVSILRLLMGASWLLTLMEQNRPWLLGTVRSSQVRKWGSP